MSNCNIQFVSFCTDANQNEAITNGKSSFQQELEGALRERKKRGLVTGFSDSENSVEDAERDNNNGGLNHE